MSTRSSRLLVGLGKHRKAATDGVAGGVACMGSRTLSGVDAGELAVSLDDGAADDDGFRSAARIEKEGEDGEQDLASAAKDTEPGERPAYLAEAHLGFEVVRVRRGGKLVGQYEMGPCFHQLVTMPAGHVLNLEEPFWTPADRLRPRWCGHRGWLRPHRCCGGPDLRALDP